MKISYIKCRRKSIKTAAISIVLAAATVVGAVFGSGALSSTSLYAKAEGESGETEKKYIKWVNYGVSYTAMKQALDYDIKTEGKICWIDLLAVAACKNGGEFADKRNESIDKTAKRISDGEKIEDITADMKYFSYYREAYTAVLGGFVGRYKIEAYDETAENKKKIVEKYGLKVFSPIAYGYSYSHCDDFGNSRSYGYKRKHLGHDMMGSVGTPIVAVEDGIVECLGWNRYGGWRVGIRSYDSKRYYYYAHLRRKHPYVLTLKEGMEVKAGDVIGYLGMTGYSDTEDYNGMTVPHLHFGMQLIFDESQKDGNGEIWIDVYNIIRLLQNSRSRVVKNEQTGDYERKYNIFPT